MSALSDTAPRALIVGWDGATWEVLLPKIRAGVMPHLARLLERSAWGILRSTWPYMTAPAWTSIVTGKRPDTHGVLDWSLAPPGQLRRSLVDSAWRTDAAFWDLCVDRGLPAGTLNLPLTWPPDPHATFCISDMFTPSLSAAFAHPAKLKPTLLELGYRLDLPKEDFYPGPLGGGGFGAYLKALIEVTRARGRAARSLLATQPWTVAMVVFTEPDRLQHAFWERLGDAGASPLGTSGPQADAFYSALDAELGAILAQVGPDTRVWMVSDHGFGPHKGAFYINEWLQKEGYLELRPETDAQRLATRALALAVRRRLLHGRGKGAASSATLDMLETRLERWGHRLTPDSRPVRWEKTLAFADTAHGVRLNIQGREPFGIVAPHEVKALRKRIQEGLLSCRDPRTGQTLHAEVLPREQLYGGRHTELAPDLVYRFLDCGYSWRIGALRRLRFGRALPEACLAVETQWETGTHRPEGLILACGEEILPGRIDAEVQCWDILPSLLYQLEQRIPPDLEGQVVQALFRPELLDSRPQRWGGARATRAGTGRLSSEDGQEGKMAERLRALGYLG